MEKFFIPYAGDLPAAIDIKGHRLLIISTDHDEIEYSLATLGGSEIREIELRASNPDEASSVLAGLAANINGGVVLAPPGIPVSAMICSLEQELPWIH
ncbi:MAG TPA: hypothetical protein PLP17_12655 [Oligoflexia bacterium]|nr:hypothetical protein [Oligoflexia bacterium]